MKLSRTISKTVDRHNSDTYLKSFIREETATVKKWAHSIFQVRPGLWPPAHRPSPLLSPSHIVGREVARLFFTARMNAPSKLARFSSWKGTHVGLRAAVERGPS
jgi:hypothetical protein